MFETAQKFWRQISNGPRERQALAFLRIATGLFFLNAGHQKLITSAFAQHLSETLQQWAADHPLAPYRQFLEIVAIPQAEAFAALVTYGEIGVGLSYVLGFLVAYSAPAAAFMNLNFLLAGQHTNPALLSINLICVLAHLSLFWGRAGHYFGFDTYVFKSSNQPAEKPAFGKTSKKLKAVKEALEKSKVVQPPKKTKKSSGKKTKSKSKPF
jgi:thiosulfate dehydrogenase [quinone] large subunit